MARAMTSMGSGMGVMAFKIPGIRVLDRRGVMHKSLL